MDLLEVLADYEPEELGNGQIKMHCAYPELHSRESRTRKQMFINPEKGIFHCFSCNSSGSLKNLLIHKLKVPYFTALEIISKVVGGVTKTKKEFVFEVEESWDIKSSPVFSTRGISDKTQKRFKVGVTKSGFTAIPYYFQNKLIAVQYRKGIKKEERFMKNIAGFKKSEFIYNYDSSKEECILVEGYTDVMRLEQFGYHAEGLWGTSFSEKQAELISKHKIVFIATDNDKAGRIALEQINFMLSKYKVKIKIVPYLEKDPGDCTRKIRWKKAIESATSYPEYCYAMALLDADYMLFKKEALKNYGSNL